jgi:phosphoribosylformimino-5-aminoimidazole carboxamide ribonucleotide (ProFAR) isomerase
MAFEVVPAIDVAGGRLVRMSGREVVPVEAEGGHPVAAAAAFVRAGASRLHFVDVDLATKAQPPNLEQLREVVALGVPVQASGGVTTRSQIEALLGAGADRVVLGSAAFGFRAETEELVGAFGDRLCVGVEADGPTIRPRDGGGELPLWETLQWLAELDVPRYVFTEVGRAGKGSGPDLDGIWALATHTDTPVLAAGGIRSIEDLRAVAALGGNVEGAIVGRALHEGLDLAEALRAVA